MPFFVVRDLTNDRRTDGDNTTFVRYAAGGIFMSSPAVKEKC